MIYKHSKAILMTALLGCGLPSVFAQTKNTTNETLDSLYIQETENPKLPEKVLHAEPLYIDLIRDLGARKGEKELNIGLGITDKSEFDEYIALVEYEWAPINRLGFEVELPFTIYPKNKNDRSPGSRLNSLKLATQYSFFVNQKAKTSMAIGYIQEFELPKFADYGKTDLLTGNNYNPFFIAAKRWGNNFHTLLYTGPVFSQHLSTKHWNTIWQINSNFHYMIPGTRNFVGIELNKEASKADFDMTIRPQMRVELTEQMIIGIVTGIPLKRENERFSSFLRIIYEPKHKK